MQEMGNLLQKFADGAVDFVVVGGFAAFAHGASRLTKDLDLCCDFSLANIERIVTALQGLNPRFSTPPYRPRLPSASDLAGYKNLYLQTDLGELDLLSEIAGVGPFEIVKQRSVEVMVFDRTIRVLSLEALIDTKRAMGRGKDLEALRELELIMAKIQND